MSSILIIQRRLKSLGFDPGPTDGILGPSTIQAIESALDKISGTTVTPEFVMSLVPASWMPWARMERIIVHWTVGTNKANSVDKTHYHIIIEGDGKLVRGDKTIKDNESAVDGVYAGHTRFCNTGSIGVSLAGMKGANEKPFDPGTHPITRDQWRVLPTVLADLCKRYAIPVTQTTVLSHAEVEKTLGIPQRGKWDISILPFDTTMDTATEVGNDFRKSTLALMQ